jgi:hypothetical protein
VEVNYFFVLRIKIGLLSLSKELSLPFTIGTIPLDQSRASTPIDGPTSLNNLIEFDQEDSDFEDEPPPSYSILDRI